MIKTYTEIRGNICRLIDTVEGWIYPTVFHDAGNIEFPDLHPITKLHNDRLLANIAALPVALREERAAVLARQETL